MKTEIFVQDEELEVYIQGEKLPRDENAIFIVGSRKMSERGRRLAWDFSYVLAKNKFTIVSGLAVGIDTMAHKGALAAAGGRTIAVLANGIDIIYPRENSRLANKIIKSGYLITTFKPKTPPYPRNFLLRNQLVAALAKRGGLIIEGQLPSGTLSTAGHAANMGIDVYAIPGSPLTDKLIEDGAIEVRKPEDILRYLGSPS